MRPRPLREDSEQFRRDAALSGGVQQRRWKACDVEKRPPRVRVTPRDRRLELDYRPTSFVIGALISALTLAAVSAGAIPW